jgi:tRNA G18 (ribose-2'-O)-methylase SpoU
MPNITYITDFEAPELDIFVRLTGAQLRSKLEPERAIFIAESPTVIEVAMNSGCKPIALLTDEKLLHGSVEKLIQRFDENVKIYAAKTEVLEKLTGFALTRGALCAMKRPELPNVSDILKAASRVAVLEAVTDSTNIGALFRSAAALNMDAVLITPTCCDPLCRRAIRVSMGTIFQVPWTRIGEKHTDWPENGMKTLSEFGFKTVAMALTDNSVSIDDEALMNEDKLAIILGTEGDGLSKSTIANCDYTVKIPMSHGVDSLNVAAAGAVAFWQLGKRK